MIVASTFAHNAKTFLDQSIGQLGGLDICLPETFRIVYLIMVIWIAAAGILKKITVRCSQRLVVYSTMTRTA